MKLERWLLSQLDFGSKGKVNYAALSFSALAAAVSIGMEQPLIGLFAPLLPLYQLSSRQESWQQKTQMSIDHLSEMVTGIAEKPVIPALHPMPSPLKPGERGRVAIFLDLANMSCAAKKYKKWVDYAKLMTEATQDDELVEAYAYVPVDEFSFRLVQSLKHKGYTTIEKPIITHADGKRTGDLDPELMVDLVEQCCDDAFDTAVLVSGDGDFMAAVRCLQKRGKRVEVISFPFNTSRELRETADKCIDITTSPICCEYQRSA